MHTCTKYSGSYVVNLHAMACAFSYTYYVCMSVRLCAVKFVWVRFFFLLPFSAEHSSYGCSMCTDLVAHSICTCCSPLRTILCSYCYGCCNIFLFFSSVLSTLLSPVLLLLPPLFVAIVVGGVVDVIVVVPLCPVSCSAATAQFMCVTCKEIR